MAYLKVRRTVSAILVRSRAAVGRIRSRDESQFSIGSSHFLGCARAAMGARRQACDAWGRALLRDEIRSEIDSPFTIQPILIEDSLDSRARDMQCPGSVEVLRG